MTLNRADILLADDDPEVRRVIADAFRKVGSRITEAGSGFDLFAQIRERAHSKAGFDFIISDVRMPGLTVVDVIEALRDASDPSDDYAPQLGDTPIILITAFADCETRDKARPLGATLLSKPFDIDELRAVALTLVAPVDDLYCDYGGDE